jgi:hypothetical protein
MNEPIDIAHHPGCDNLTRLAAIRTDHPLARWTIYDLDNPERDVHASDPDTGHDRWHHTHDARIRPPFATRATQTVEMGADSPGGETWA